MFIQPEIEIFQLQGGSSLSPQAGHSIVRWLELLARLYAFRVKTSACLTLSHDPDSTLENTESPISLPHECPVYKNKSRLRATK